MIPYVSFHFEGEDLLHDIAAPKSAEGHVRHSLNS